ncbi:MAG: cyclic nucleotide-binding domain-containing protein [Acidimicrobiia bacterium]
MKNSGWSLHPTLDLEERILLHDPSLTDFEPTPVEFDDHVEYLSFAPGAVIVEQGEKAGSVYWIEEGRVEVIKIADSGKALPLVELAAGRYFGELAAIMGTRRSSLAHLSTP